MHIQRTWKEPQDVLLSEERQVAGKHIISHLVHISKAPMSETKCSRSYFPLIFRLDPVHVLSIEL